MTRKKKPKKKDKRSGKKTGTDPDHGAGHRPGAGDGALNRPLKGYGGHVGGPARRHPTGRAGKNGPGTGDWF